MSLKKLYEYLKKNNITVSFAESCTGGLLSSKITTISGISDYFLGSIIVYSNEIKKKVLNVNSDILDKFGAVSKETAREMVLNCRKLFNSDFSVSITGIAGPSGGTPEKPVGTVWFGFYYMKTDKIITIKKQFNGTRIEIQNKAVEFVIKKIVDF